MDRRIRQSETDINSRRSSDSQLSLRDTLREFFMNAALSEDLRTLAGGSGGPCWRLSRPASRIGGGHGRPLPIAIRRRPTVA